MGGDWYVEHRGEQKKQLYEDVVSYQETLDKLLPYLRYMGMSDEVQENKPMWQKVHCPFHNDTNPSGSVNPYKKRFMCFACDMQGNVISLVMRDRNCSYKEALAWIRNTL